MKERVYIISIKGLKNHTCSLTLVDFIATQIFALPNHSLFNQHPMSAINVL